jgi:energy-coupling factor transport system permease protein
MRYYPSIKASEITPFSILVYIAYFALCMIPVLINMVEAMKWKSIESKN